MDPLACISRIDSAISEPEEAADAIEDYVTWRERGGFEPAGGGDAKVLKLAAEALAFAEESESGVEWARIIRSIRDLAHLNILGSRAAMEQGSKR